MNKKQLKRKDTWITFLVIAGILVVSLFVLSDRNSYETEEDFVRCLGNNSTLYVQDGCSHCETQLDMFGRNRDDLRIVDCFNNQKECINEGVSGTPSWKINGKIYAGVKSINKLKDLSGC